MICIFKYLNLKRLKVRGNMVILNIWLEKYGECDIFVNISSIIHS